MCYAVKCSACGKTGWGGCGRHVPGVYKKIEQGQHCLCHDWPGVPAAGDGGPSAADQIEAAPSSSCTIL